MRRCTWLGDQDATLLDRGRLATCRSHGHARAGAGQGPSTASPACRKVEQVVRETRRAIGDGKGCYAGAMSRELRTYSFTVVVEPADEMRHAYCKTVCPPRWGAAWLIEAALW